MKNKICLKMHRDYVVRPYNLIRPLDCTLIYDKGIYNIVGVSDLAQIEASGY